VTATKSEQIQTFSELDKPYGITYGQWTVRWWQWALSVPLGVHPIADDTGQHWKTNQPTTDVWFLVGIFGGVGKIFPHRKIKIESGRSILFPVLNCEANSLEYPELKTHDDIKKHVVDDVNTVVKKDCIINGSRIIPVRVPSDPTIFTVTIVEDNAFSVKNPGSTDAAADGYWVFLKPLPKGNYNIRFEGSCEFGRLNAGASYDIEVI
jgi:hypothetical protein